MTKFKHDLPKIQLAPDLIIVIGDDRFLKKKKKKVYLSDFVVN